MRNWIRLWLAWSVCCWGPAIPAYTQTELRPVDSTALRTTYRDNGTYLLRLQYRDPKGDDILKATFHDESRAGAIPIEHQSIVGSPSDPEGATITWQVNGFEKGDHKGYFVVATDLGETRWPGKPSDFWNFKVESLLDKWLVVVVGWVLSLIGVPFLIYLAARALNPRGNPSSAARIGLILGLLLALGIFVQQFLGTYDNPLIWVLAGIAFLGLFVVILTRR